MLITGPEPGWAEVASAGSGLDLHVVAVGSEYEDLDGTWARLREVPQSGAVLVRPDNHVAWRGAGPPDDPVAVLRAVLGTVLGGG